MAVNTNQGYTMGYGSYQNSMAGPGYFASEEERLREEERRRREAEDAARLAEISKPAVPMVEQPGIPAAAQTIGAPVVPKQQAQPAEQPQRELPPGVELVDGKLRLTGVQPGPGVQVAGPAQLPVQQAPAEQPKTALDLFTEAAGDTNKLMQLYNDKNQPAELRRIAGREAGRLLDSDTRRAEAETQISQMSQGDLEKLLRTKSEEGSWGKRILFGLLNMKGAMDAEDAKLGIGAKWNTTTVTDPKTGESRNVLVQTRADGLPMIGYDTTTGMQLDAKTLASVPTGAAKLNIVGGTYVNDKTGEVGRVVTDERTGTSYIQTDTGRKPMTGFRPQASAGTLADMNTRQIQELNNKLAYAGPTASAAAREKIIAESEAQYGPLPEEYKARVRGAQPQPAVQQAPQAATAQTAAQPAVQQAPQAAPATQPRPAAPVSPAQLAQQAPAAPARVPQAGVAAAGGATPAARELAQFGGKQRIETEATIEREERKPGAQARGKIEAKDVNNQNYADSTYGLIKPISDSIKQSTGSSIGAGADKLAGVVGVGTRGAENIAKLEVLGYQLLSNVPRFEGPQSDIDVQMYKQAAGDLANSSKPVNVRLAALDSIVMMLKKYDKAGTNDWSFGQGGNIKIIKREKVQ